MLQRSKKILSLLLAVVLVLGMVPMTAMAADVEEPVGIMPLSAVVVTTEAELRAEIAAGNDVIVNNTITLTGGSIGIANTVAISGTGTITVGGSSRHFQVNTSGNLTLAGVTLQGNHPAIGGGVNVNSGGSFTMNAGSSIRDNVHLGNAGGLWILAGATFTMNGGSIENNHANPSGGGIFISNGGTANLVAGYIVGNTAVQSGAGIVASGSLTVADAVVIRDNHATESAGGIIVTETGTATITGATIEGNTAGHAGGALFVVDGGTATVTGATIEGNTAGRAGGALFVAGGGTATVTNSQFTGNSATRRGDDVFYNNLANVVLTNNSIETSVESRILGGYFQSTFPNGTIVITPPDYNSSPTPDTSVQYHPPTMDEDGRIVVNLPPLHPGGAVTLPDGTEVDVPGGGSVVWYPDGSYIVFDEDGTVIEIGGVELLVATVMGADTVFRGTDTQLTLVVDESTAAAVVENLEAVLAVLVWGVGDTSGNPIAGVTINQDGLLTVGAAVDFGTNLRITTTVGATELYALTTITTVPHAEIEIDVDGEGNVDVTVEPDQEYSVGTDGDGNLVITFPDADPDDDIIVNLPDGWVYRPGEDEDGNMMIIITPPDGYELVEYPPGSGIIITRPVDPDPDTSITVDVDEEGTVTVTVEPEQDYSIGTDGDGNLVITLPDADPDDDITINLPPGWDHEVGEDEDGNVIIIITPPGGYELVEYPPGSGNFVVYPPQLPDNIIIRPDYEIEVEDGDMTITVPDAPNGPIVVEVPEDGNIVVTVPGPDNETTVVTVPPDSEIYIDEDFNVTITVPGEPPIVIEICPDGNVTITPPGESFPPGSEIEVDEDGNVYVNGDRVWPELHLAFMVGVGNNRFNPNGTATRAEVATVLVRTLVEDFVPGTMPPGMASHPFTDTTTHWARYYIAWAFAEELVQGVGGNRFDPNAPITRQEFAAMLARTVEVHATGNIPFADLSCISNWAQRYVYSVYREDLMQGVGGNRFAPLDNINRASIATAMNRNLGRLDSRDAFAAVSEIVDLDHAIAFEDVPATAWFFPSVIAATNDHYLTRGADGAVDWMQIIR
ncbi:MAG: S-layer homology domain-containing protein [Oscillospiraceae bacterium]|nr:S-layer homology domain-containing protein [Oscillospiraceae bacterium]